MCRNMDRWPMYQCNIWIQASLKLWQQYLYLHIPLVKQLHLLSPNLDFLSKQKGKMAIQWLFRHSIYFNFQYGPVFNLYHLVAAIMAKTTQTLCKGPSMAPTNQVCVRMIQWFHIRMLFFFIYFFSIWSDVKYNI